MSIYLITQKEFNQKLPDNYRVMVTGSNFHIDVKNADFYDNSGSDNISDKNQYYSELSGFYWLWKNIKDEYIGFVHYRRFFPDIYESKIVDKGKKIYSKVSMDKIITDEQIKDILNKKDMIVMRRWHRNRTIRMQYNMSSGKKEDWIAVEKVINSVCPEYYDDLLKVIDGHFFYPCNLFITKKELFDQYCSWIFSILFSLESEIDYKQRTGYFKRVFGYLAERLLTVYILHNKLNVYELPIIYIDRQSFPQRVMTRIKKSLIKD